ncbi:MAG: prepilin peptidase [Candidatus Colwellbacteria bacterium]|nr:prepilin peptidase [Candidatus Colwellbacteria bacterium]
MIWDTVLFLFILGAATGSFLNVLASRYSERSGFKKALHGRSHCDHCRRRLRWYELIPVFSFIFLRGRCRSCKKRIPALYTAVEVLASLLAVFVPLKIGLTPLALTWTLVFWLLLLISLIDLRLKIIPDSLVVFVALLGAVNLVYRYLTGLAGSYVTTIGLDLLGHYSMVLKLGPSPLMNHLAAVMAGLVLFGGIYLLTRGRAMGLGDVKLAGALGLLVAWPDIIVVLIVPFLMGTLIGLPMMWLKKMNLKSSIPFGPFIALGVLLTFFFGYDIVNAYFGLLNLA